MRENTKNCIEVEAKTTQEAIKIALGKLGAKREDVEIRILREEHKGLFGMEGAEQAKIKVVVKKNKIPRGR
ncbi:MAG: Jag N-terminal domain-containing protein [Omnitrophica bacterium]|nr:Jag N-terminal domain-containing protein [Candidatus Omnitrophota bacterium]